MSKYSFLLGNQNAKIYTEKDYDLIVELINNYFDECEEDGRPFTMSGLANALRISKNTLSRYENDKSFGDLIKQAKQIVEQQIEENGLMGKANSTFSIFNLKNNYGWRDSTETKVEANIDNITPLINMIMTNNEKEEQDD